MATHKRTLLKWKKNLGERAKNISLFQKLFCLSFFIMIIPMVIFDFYSVRTMGQIAVDQVLLETEDSVYLAASNIENLLSKIVSVQLFLYEDQELNEISEELMDLPKEETDSREKKLLNIRFADRVDEILKSMLFNTVVTRSNVTMLSSQGVALTNYQYDGDAMEEWIEAYLCKGTPTQKTIEWFGLSDNIDAAFDSQDPRMLTLSKSMDIKAGSGNQWVSLMISIMENPLSEMFAGEELKNDRFLVDQNGMIFSCNHKEMIGQNFLELFQGISMEKESDTIFTEDVQKETSVISYRKLEISPWTIVDVKPYKGLADGIRNNGGRLLLVNLLSVALFLGIAGLAANGISKPLSDLASTMSNAELAETTYGMKKAERAGREIRKIYQSYEVMRVEISNLLRKNEAVQKRKREMELAVLQAQIKPHFLFNTLMSIRCAIMNGHDDKAAEMTLALSNFLRVSIGKSDEVICLSEELDNIQTYLQVQNMRSYQQIELRMDVPDELKNYPVPRLLFQPLIENSIVHGFREMEKGRIEISAVTETDKVRIQIRDNGAGFQENPLEYSDIHQIHSSVGVANVLERIHLYYGEEYGMQFENRNGTMITIELPVEKGMSLDVHSADRG